MRRSQIVLFSLAAAILTTSGGYALDASADRGSAALGPGFATVQLGIEHSRFGMDRIEVKPGTTVRFVVTNTDPILHELIVGDDEVHDRHADGNEAHHPTVPGEVTVGPGEMRSTLFTFSEPGTVKFACHLPGHLAYGMEGVVVVRD